MKQEDYERAIEIKKQIRKIEEEILSLTPGSRGYGDCRMTATRKLLFPSKQVVGESWENKRQPIYLTDDDLEILRNRRHYTLYELREEFDELGNNKDAERG